MLVRTKSQVLSWLRAQVGRTESPAGSNNVVYAQAYGMNRQPWCAMFVWCALSVMGTKPAPFKSAYVPSWVSWAKKQGHWRTRDYRAKAGDLVVFQMPGPRRPNHIGFVVADRASATAKVATIEGNTGGSNPRMGGMVAAQKRTTTYIVGFIDMQGLYKPKPKKTSAKRPKAPTFTLKFILKRGSKHKATVKLLQARLNALGYRDSKGRALVVDGEFGSATDASVRRFQRSRKLKADGIVGKATAQELGWKWGR